MLRKKVPFWFAIPVVFGLASVLYAVDNSVSEKAVHPKAVVWSEEDCLKCHLNTKTLKRMQSKRGDTSYCQATYDRLTKDKPDTAKAASGYKSDNWK